MLWGWVVSQGTTCIINPLIATWTFNSLGTQCPRCKRTSNCLTAHLLGGGEMCDCRNPLWTKPYYELFVRKPPGKYKRTDNAVTQGWNVTFLVIGAYSTGALLKYTSVIICQYHNWHFTRFELIPVYCAVSKYCLVSSYTRPLFPRIQYPCKFGIL